MHWSFPGYHSLVVIYTVLARWLAPKLANDPRLRKLCLIKTGEAGYPRSVLSRFIRKVGEDKLNKMIEEKVVKLLKASVHACNYKETLTPKPKPIISLYSH